MKKEVSRKVNVCDRCDREVRRGNEILMFNCPVCGKECCSDCNERNIFEKFPDICESCAKVPEIRKYLNHLTRVYYTRMKQAKKKLASMKNYLPKDSSND